MIVCVFVNWLLVLLVDEFIGNFDLEISRDIMDLLEWINCIGMMVLMVMYDYYIVDLMC